MATSITLGFQGVKQRMPAAIARALNRSIASAKTVMVREVSRDLGLKSATVRDAMRLTEAKPGDTSVTLSVTGKPIPLIAFGAKASRRNGVTAKLPPPGAGRYPRAFITTVGSGRHVGVFERRGKARLPIYELHGPSLPHVFRKYIPVGLARAEEQLAKNLASEFRYALSRA